MLIPIKRSFSMAPFFRFVFLVGIGFFSETSFGFSERGHLNCEAENKKYIICFLAEFNAWGKIEPRTNFLMAFAEKATQSVNPWGETTWDTSVLGNGGSPFIRRKAVLKNDHFSLDVAYKHGKHPETIKIEYDLKKDAGYADLWLAINYGKPPVNIRLNKMKCSFDYSMSVDCRLPSW
jgi:hypothetical protein